MPDIYQHHFDNGLVLLVEPLRSLRSVGMSLLTPAGVAAQPADQQGVATVLAEMVTRGAGGLTGREHSDRLDSLGVQRSTGASSQHLAVSASLLGDRFDEAFPLLADMIHRPTLDADALGPAVALALQDLASLEDNPQQQALLDLQRLHFPEPFGRNALGQRDNLEALSLDCVRAFCAKRCAAKGTILGVAGAVDPQAVQALVERELGEWTGSAASISAGPPPPPGQYHHKTTESQQVHIALGFPAPPATDEHFEVQRVAASVLSGGMSSRLFTEVREKRGLVYSVMARYMPQREFGAIIGYAGTTTPRAGNTRRVPRRAWPNT